MFISRICQLTVESDEEVDKKSTVKRNEEVNSLWYYPDRAAREEGLE